MNQFDNNFKRYIIFTILIFVILMTGCDKKSAVYENDIFIKDTYKSLVEIDYWLGDTKIVIDR